MGLFFGSAALGRGLVVTAAGGGVACAVLGAAEAQPADDFLPQIPQGDIAVQLESFATGLSGNFNGTNQFFPTKLVALPGGGGRNLVSTFGGLLRVVDNNGSFLDAPLGGAFLDTNTAATDIGPFAFGVTSVAVHPDFDQAGTRGVRQNLRLGHRRG